MKLIIIFSRSFSFLLYFKYDGELNEIFEWEGSNTSADLEVVMLIFSILILIPPWIPRDGKSWYALDTKNEGGDTI